MVIIDNKPFSVVDDEGFVEYVREVNPRVKIPSRWTVARDCLNIYMEEAKVLKNLLKGQRLSLTTDTWTSVQNINYMCLTAHWVDDDWKLQKNILNFCQIANHKGETIGKLVYACLGKWGIDKIFTITVDNVSSNDGAIRFLKNELTGPDAILDCAYMHLRCCAHIINLVVKDGLEDQHDSVLRIRKALRYVRSSPSRLLKFQECVHKEKIKCEKKVCLDVETRWNSTYLMLETAMKFERVFNRLGSHDNSYEKYFFGGDDEDVAINTRRGRRKKKEATIGPLMEEDWENARYFIEFLKIFYKVTLKISGSKYATSNLFFNELVRMHVKIGKMCSSGDIKCNEMGKRMKAKYDKYWETLITSIFFYIYAGEREKQIIMSERVKKTLADLYEDYIRLHKNLSGGGTTAKGYSSDVTPISIGEDDDDDFDMEANFRKHLEAKETKENKSELKIYLSDDVEKILGNDDVLLWWKSNSTKFPILSQLAKNVLGMPITSVTSESAFSTGWRIIDPFRSSLTPRTAEALICAQDWLRSKPTDIESSLNFSFDEMREKLEEVEKDEFSRIPKYLEECVIDD